MKLDIDYMAHILHGIGVKSTQKNIDDILTEHIINELNLQLIEWTDNIKDKLEELEHPDPETLEEYNERNNVNED